MKIIVEIRDQIVTFHNVTRWRKWGSGPLKIWYNGNHYTWIKDFEIVTFDVVS